jgi:hypothetical protein
MAMEQFDWGLWLGVVSLALAIPLGIVTNLFTPRVVGYLERRKVLKTHRTRQQALRTYRLVRAFHAGRRDKYVFYIVWGNLAVIFEIFGVMAALLLLVGDFDRHEMLWVVALIALLCVLVGFSLLMVIFDTAKKLENFDEYKADIEKRWAPITEEDLKDR